MSMVTSVDLPAPDAPTKATMLLGGMVRLTLSRTFSEPPYPKDTLVIVIGRSKSGAIPLSSMDSSRSESSSLSLRNSRTLPEYLRNS